MENKKKIPVIAMAIFMCVILLAQNNIERVYALSLFNITINSSSGNMDYATGVDRYVIHHTSPDDRYTSVNPATNATVTFNFGTSANTYQGLACDATVCYTKLLIGTGSSSDRMITFNPVTGAILSNVTFGVTGMTASENNENSVFKGGWFSAVCTSGSGRVLRNVNGLQLGVCGGTTFGANIIGNIRQSSDGLFYGVTTGSTSGFLIWNANTLTLVCSAVVTLGKTTPLEEYNNNFYVVVTTTTINKYSTACASGTGITGTGLSDQFMYLLKSTGRGEFYVISAGNVAVMNLTSSNISTRLYSFPFDGSSTTNSLNSAINNEYKQLAKVNPGGSTLSIAQLEPFSAEEEPANSAFCAIPGNENLLQCRLITIGNGELGSFADLVGDTFGNSTNNLFVQLGLVPAGSDIQTNGVGYMFVVVGLALMCVMFYLATGGDLDRIPTFVWFLGTLSVLGGFTAFGFVDITFFLIGVIAIIALASAKIVSTLDLGRF